MTQKQTLEQKMQELRESDPFAADANIDLRGLPSFLQAEVEELESRPDPFDQIDTMQTTISSKNGLRNFLQNLDNESVKDAASRPGADPRLLADHLDREAEEVGIEFRQQVGSEYVQCEENYVALVDWLCSECLKYCPDQSPEDNVELLQSKGWWTTENLLVAFNALYQSGELPAYPAGVARTLTATTLTEMQRLCQMGQVLDGIALGLRKTFDLNQYANLDKVLIDPAKTPVVNEVILFCWKAAQPDYDSRQDEAFTSFVYSFAGERGLNIPICQSAWEAFKTEQKSIFRDRALGIKEPEQPDFSPEGFDHLDDKSLEDLRLAVTRERAKSK